MGYEQKIKQGNYLHDKVVIDGKIVTSRGPATVYAFAYKLVDLLGGNSLALKKEWSILMLLILRRMNSMRKLQYW